MLRAALYMTFKPSRLQNRLFRLRHADFLQLFRGRDLRLHVPQFTCKHDTLDYTTNILMFSTAFIMAKRQQFFQMLLRDVPVNFNME